MASFNKITIVGYLGRDPELRYTPQGVAVCNLNIATTERRKNAKGENEDITTWFKVSVWRQPAEFCNQYMQKGSQVFIQGTLRLEEYTDREGQKRQNLIVNATDAQLLGGRPGAGASAPEPATSAEDAEKRREALNATKSAKDDDIPF